MSAYEQALLMRIFVSESDQFGNHPLYEERWLGLSEQVPGCR
jgi:PII-like signaling protein